LTRYRKFINQNIAIWREFRSTFRPSREVSSIRRPDSSSDRGVAQYGRPGVGIAMAILLAAS